MKPAFVWIGGLASIFNDTQTERLAEVGMVKGREIQAAVESLPQKEYARFRQWFSTRDWEQWDKQIEEDSEAGRLDFLLKEAAEEEATGYLREL